MALPVLRPVPKDDPRPTIRSLEVLTRAYEPSEVYLMNWAVARGITMDQPELRACIVAGVQAGDQDAYIAARCLEEAFGFHSDYQLVLLLNDVIQIAPTKLSSVIREWVLRTRLRFPAKPGDLVVYRDKWRHHRVGRVDIIRNSEASAMVVSENTEKTEIVWAENVVENRTSGETTDRPAPVTLPGKITPIR